MLWSRYRGQRDPRVDGGEQSLGYILTCGGGAVVDSGAVVAEAEGSGLGGSPGAQAELRWGLLAAVVRWGGECTAAQRRGTAEQGGQR